jgi:drug/metabolite transporter (DMT)-like permease
LRNGIQMENERRRAVANYAMLVAAAVLLGSLFSVNKWAAISGVPPLAYTFWQALVGGALLWIGLTITGRRLPISQQHTISYVVIGALVIGFPVSLLALVAGKLPASVVTLVLALSPPFTFAISVVMRVERFRVFGLLGLIVGFLGVLVIVSPGTTTLGGAGNWQWFLLALLAPLLFAVANVLAALLRPPAASSAVMSAGILFGSCLILLPVLLISGQTWWLPVRLDAGVAATVLAALINAAFQVLFFEISSRVSPSFLSQFDYLAVPAGAAWSVLLFGEHISIYYFLALLLMFMSMFLTEYKRVPQRPA